MSGQAFAIGTCISAGNGNLDSTTTNSPWAGGADTGCAAATVAAPDSTNDLSIGAHIIFAPTATPISVNSVAFTGAGTLELIGKTLNVGTTLSTCNGCLVTIGMAGTLSVTGNITNPTGGTLNAQGGTLILGGNLNSTGTLTLGSETVKILGNSTITLAAAATINVLDLSTITSGSTITFVGAFNNTVTTLTLPTAGATAKTVIFKVPNGQTLQLPAATTGCVATGYTFTGGLMTGTATATDNVTCTISANTSPIKASVDLRESGKVTTTSEEISIK